MHSNNSIAEYFCYVAKISVQQYVDIDIESMDIYIFIIFPEMTEPNIYM